MWASTSTKNPTYPDTLYVDNLIGQGTINTAPPHTIEAWRDHGTLAATLETDLDEAQAVMDGLAQADVDMDDVTDQLLEEGIDKFEKPYNNLIDAIREKCNQLATSAAD